MQHSTRNDSVSSNSKLSDVTTQINFQFGLDEPSQKPNMLLAAVLNLVVDRISAIFKIDRVRLWRIIDDFSRDLNIAPIQRIILNSPELIDARIEAEVDSAIEEYQKTQPDLPVLSPIFSETKEGETLLGGEMRSTWKFMDKE